MNYISVKVFGEGNGTPLQYSCLENPRDGGAWWAAVYGVTQSRTRLKRLSSSSSKGIQCIPGSSSVKNPPAVPGATCSTGDPGSIPGSGRSPGEGNGNLFQYWCLENLMDRGAWWATIHAIAKSRTQLSDFTSLHNISSYYYLILLNK